MWTADDKLLEDSEKHSGKAQTSEQISHRAIRRVHGETRGAWNKLFFCVVASFLRSGQQHHKSALMSGIVNTEPDGFLLHTCALVFTLVSHQRTCVGSSCAIYESELEFSW